MYQLYTFLLAFKHLQNNEPDTIKIIGVITKIENNTELNLFVCIGNSFLGNFIKILYYVNVIFFLCFSACLVCRDFTIPYSGRLCHGWLVAGRWQLGHAPPPPLTVRPQLALEDEVSVSQSSVGSVEVWALPLLSTESPWLSEKHSNKLLGDIKWYWNQKQIEPFCTHPEMV